MSENSKGENAISKLKEKTQQQALAIKKAADGLKPSAKTAQYDLPFTYEICVPETQFIDRRKCAADGFQLIPANQKIIDQEDVVEVEFEKSIIDADKWDYIVAAASGLLIATMNIL